MPVFSKGRSKPECIPFNNLGPWLAKLVEYREAPSKKWKFQDGTPKNNAFLDFQIMDPRVLAKIKDKPVIKTLICGASLFRSDDGKRTSPLYDALKTITGTDPTPNEIGAAMKKKPAELTEDDLFAWIGNYYDSEVQILLRPVEEKEDGSKEQTVDKVLPLVPQDGDAL